MTPCAPTLRPLKDDRFAFGHAEKPGILMVHDGKPVRGTVSVALESAGYRLYVVSDGEDALLKYQQTRTELIVLKLYSPDVTAPILFGGFGSEHQRLLLRSLCGMKNPK